MIYLYIFGIAVIMYFSVCVRVAVFHPFNTVTYAVRDFVKWFKYKEWRI